MMASARRKSSWKHLRVMQWTSVIFRNEKMVHAFLKQYNICVIVNIDNKSDKYKNDEL